MNADAAFTETNHAEMKPMSGMAVTAFVLTLLFCIPVLPLVGLLLGLAALGRTSTDGPLRGRPLARRPRAPAQRIVTKIQCDSGPGRNV